MLGADGLQVGIGLEAILRDSLGSVVLEQLDLIAAQTADETDAGTQRGRIEILAGGLEAQNIAVPLQGTLHIGHADTGVQSLNHMILHNKFSLL